jgi:acyl-coenzyme A thioesterase PaaI-like protein
MSTATGFDRLVAALREVQDRVAGTRPPGEVCDELTRRLQEVSRQLSGFAVGEDDQLWNRVGRTPGRGQAFVPVITIDSTSATAVTGRVRFSRTHLGAYGKAHGGALALVLDDIMGRLSNKDRSWAPTAELTVRFLRPVPIDVDLDVAARVTDEAGRTRTLTGTISAAGVTLAAASGTWRVPARADRNLSLDAR